MNAQYMGWHQQQGNGDDENFPYVVAGSKPGLSVVAACMPRFLLPLPPISRDMQAFFKIRPEATNYMKISPKLPNIAIRQWQNL